MLILTLAGQCPSGKNGIKFTRTGLRYPSKRFVAWRADVLQQINKQLSELNKKSLPLDKPVSVDIHYFPGDNRGRDVPGVIDALWHVLEKANIITNDKYLGNARKYRRGETHFYHYPKDPKPRVGLSIYE